MRYLATITLLFVLAGIAGCAEESPAPTASSATVTPAVATEPAAAEAEPVATPKPKRVLPEDEVLDAEREAPIRVRAQELHAIRPEAVRDVELGEEAVVLVRGRARGPGAGAIYGSGPYTYDSPVRVTAIHAGLLQHDELGLVRITMIKHEGKHEREARNGVRPHGWGEYPLSYTLERVELP